MNIQSSEHSNMLLLLFFFSVNVSHYKLMFLKFNNKYLCILLIHILVNVLVLLFLLCFIILAYGKAFYV